jgi:curli biogenesis system outer membrane secretion channel CsgG
MRFRRTSGGWVRASALLLALALPACNYGFTGGGGLPNSIRTIYIAPFDNQTDRSDLDQQVNRALTEELPRALGLRPAGERNADLIVRGTIMRYDDQASSYRPGTAGNIDVEQHQVQITLAIQLIDVRENLVRYESQSVSGRGEYRPSSQSDEAARVLALRQVIQQIVDGAQSQW